jgi:hypothetical protein
MPQGTVRAATLISAAFCFALILAASPSRAQSPTYFGPVKATVGGAGEVPLAGYPFNSPVHYAHMEWFVGDQGFHPSVCIVLLDGYGQGFGTKFAEVNVQVAYTSLYSAWHQRTGLNISWSADSAATCGLLLASGTCLQVSGRIFGSADVFGQTTVVDSVSYPAGCP